MTNQLTTNTQMPPRVGSTGVTNSRPRSVFLHSMFNSVLVCSVLTSAQAQNTIADGVIAQNYIANGGFETPLAPVGPQTNNYTLIPESSSNGWFTTGSTQRIELWREPFNGVVTSTGSSLYEGGYQFAELNSDQRTAIYQDVVLTQNAGVDYFFLHRGRAGLDSMRFSVLSFGSDGVLSSTYNAATGSYTLAGDDALMIDRVVSTDNVQSAGEINGWKAYYGENAFTSVIGQKYRVALGAVSTYGNNPTVGNFVDNIALGYSANDLVPEPSAVVLSLAGLALTLRRRR